jgi:hypothetical protein
MNGCIAERPKLLMWLENTFKQKKKPEYERDGRSRE